MFIIKISDLSYKVTLSQSDFGKYGKDIFDGGENSKTFFCDVIEKVSKEYNQVNKTAVIHADFFEDKFGGGELFLYFSDTSIAPLFYILKCDDFENIIISCKIINTTAANFSSKLIYMSGFYYLILDYVQKEKEPPSSLYEMGKLFKADYIFILHLEEHGKVILKENAIEKTVLHFK